MKKILIFLLIVLIAIGIVLPVDACPSKDKKKVEKYDYKKSKKNNKDYNKKHNDNNNNDDEQDDSGEVEEPEEPVNGKLSWKGYTWNVRSWAGAPGPCTWDPSGAYVDSSGNLHLTIQNINGVWQASEVDSSKLFKYGTYTWTLSSSVQNLDKNVCLGLFTYKDDGNELDIEFSKWGVSNGNLLWFSNQPTTVAGFKVSSKPVKCQIDWQPSKVTYSVWDSSGNLIGTGTSTSDIPSVDSYLIMNLWMMDNKAPSNGQPVDVVLSGFSYVPYSEGSEEEPPAEVSDTVKNAMIQMTTTFENSDTKLHYNYAENLGDGRGITFGCIGFCTGTYDGNILIKHYTELNPDNTLEKYIPALNAIDSGSHNAAGGDGNPSTAGLDGFIQAVQNCNDPLFKQAQLDMLDELYYNPAMKLADNAGCKYPLTRAFIYDSCVRHGTDDAKRMISQAGTTPKQGADELTFLNNMFTVRDKRLKNEGLGDTNRVQSYKNIVSNPNLVVPFTFKAYGESFTITGVL